MREIKFRAWSLRHKRMIEFDSHKHGIQYSNGELVVSTGWDSMDEPTYESATPGDHIILQFIGVIDKNGKEVYEGDVVNFHGFMYAGDGGFSEADYFGVGQILYDPFNAQFLISKEDRSWAIIGTSHHTEPCIEIIGNIFENPDLLNTGA